MFTTRSKTLPVLPILLLSGLLGSAHAVAAQVSEDHKLLPIGGQAGDQFGSTVGTDGTLVAIGASGSAYLFDARSGDQLLELVPSDAAAGFGASVAVDGPFAVVGAPFADGAVASAGAAYVFDTTTGNQLLKLEASDAATGDQLGTAVAVDGGLIVVGARNGAYVFAAATGQEFLDLIPIGGLPVGGSGIAEIEGGFGQAVDIDGNFIVVGAKTANGSTLYSGAAFVFDTAGNQLQKLSAGGAYNQFGGSVGIDGTTVVVGARYASPNGKDSGQAYLFDGATGSLIQNLVPTDGHLFAHFGSAVAIDGLHVVVGAEQDNGNGFASGAAYVYDSSGGSPVVKLGASDAAPNDELGVAVAVASGVIVAGANRDDDLGATSGSAYVFDGAGAVTAIAECFGNAGSLTQVGGIAVAGQALEFRLDAAQPGANLALLVVSGAPVPGPCGVDLGSAGELLIDASPLSVLATSSAAWTGSPVDLPVAVPAVSGLIGLHVFVQGAFLAPLSPTEPVRLTGGLDVALGGYL